MSNKLTKEKLEELKKVKALKVKDAQIIRKDGNTRDSRKQKGISQA